MQCVIYNFNNSKNCVPNILFSAILAFLLILSNCILLIVLRTVKRQYFQPSWNWSEPVLCLFELENETLNEKQNQKINIEHFKYLQQKNELLTASNLKETPPTHFINFPFKMFWINRSLVHRTYIKDRYSNLWSHK